MVRTRASKPKDREQDKRLDQVVKEMNRMKAAVELKYFDSASASVILDSGTPTVLHLTSVSEGDSSTQRTGLKINPQFVDFRLFFKKGGIGVTNSEWARVLIVRDNEQVSGTAPSAADVIAGGSSSYAAALPNRLKPARFTYYYDKLVMLSDENPLKLLSDRVSLPKTIPTRYDGVSASNIAANGYYLIVVGGNNANFGTYDRHIHLRFTDM